MICETCKKSVEPGEEYTQYNEANYHSECFTCNRCKDPLEAVCVHEGKEYCKKCYMIMVNPNMSDDVVLKCHNCTKFVSNTDSTALFKDKIFHEFCLKCCLCTRYILIGESVGWPHQSKLPRCIDCTGNRFCSECNKYISNESSVLVIGDDQYHAECLKCKNCSTVINDTPFHNPDGHLVCKKCASLTFSTNDTPKNKHTAIQEFNSNRPQLSRKDSIDSRKFNSLGPTLQKKASNAIMQGQSDNSSGCIIGSVNNDESDTLDSNALGKGRMRSATIKTYNSSKSSLLIDNESIKSPQNKNILNKPVNILPGHRPSSLPAVQKLISNDTTKSNNNSGSGEGAEHKSNDASHTLPVITPGVECCNACKRRLEGDYKTALNKVWHPECFLCVKCNTIILDRFYSTPEGDPYCSNCHDIASLRLCILCNISSKLVAGSENPHERFLKDGKDNFYHESCLKCAICSKEYKDFKLFAVKGGKNYCREHRQ